VNQEVLHWIDHTPQRPFFAFLNYFDAHGPYGLPRSYPRPAWSQASEMDLYDDGIRYVDDNLGQLLEALQQRGLNNTLVVVTSDHGEGLWQHGLPTHGRALYRELIHVPLIFWCPGHIAPGLRVATPVTNASIASTVMELVGANSQPAFPEPSLSVLWGASEVPPEWPATLSELAQNRYEDGQDRSAKHQGPTSTTGSMKSLVTPQWHLILHEKLGEQLYDWGHDPGESHNVVGTPEGQEVARHLASQMQGILTRSASTSSGPSRDLESSTRSHGHHSPTR
jgi:arylsulfatase A-like enzyme